MIDVSRTELEQHPTADRCFFCVTDEELDAAMTGRPYEHVIHMQIPQSACPFLAGTQAVAGEGGQPS